MVRGGSKGGRGDEAPYLPKSMDTPLSPLFIFYEEIIKKRGRGRRREREEEDDKRDEHPLDMLARFATACVYQKVDMSSDGEI